jgi:Na+/melibiose symporter-like transporter
MGLIFLSIYFLGRLPMSPEAQIYLFALLASMPVAILGIIPYAVISEIAQLDGLITGVQKEGMYFAVRNFFYKIGMTIGIICFTILTLWGKDPGDDWDKANGTSVLMYNSRTDISPFPRKEIVTESTASLKRTIVFITIASATSLFSTQKSSLFSSFHEFPILSALSQGFLPAGYSVLPEFFIITANLVDK